MTDAPSPRCSSGSARELAEELREYTAMKYAGDCKCGKCQLVPRALVQLIYHTLNGTGDVAQAAPEPAYKCAAPCRAACNWPTCGCDPKANEVIQALVDDEWTAPSTYRERGE